ncbi:hypothetical protein ACFX1R_034442 [Malus domestica]
MSTCSSITRSRPTHNKLPKFRATYLAIERGGVVPGPEEIEQALKVALFRVVLHFHNLQVLGGAGTHDLVTRVVQKPLGVPNLCLCHVGYSLKLQLDTPEAPVSKMSEMLTREDVGKSVRIGEHVLCPHEPEKLDNDEKGGSETLLGVAIGERVPGDDVLVRNGIKYEVGSGQVPAFGVEVDDGVGDVYAGYGTGFDDVGMDRLAILEVLLAGELDDGS